MSGPEVRDWLENLIDSGFRRVDEVCGLLAEKGSELGGHGLITWKGRFGNYGSGCAMLRQGSPTGVLLPALRLGS